MSTTEHELGTILRENPAISIVIGGATSQSLLNIDRRIDPDTVLSVGVYMDQTIVVTRYVTGKPAQDTFLTPDNSIPQKEGGPTWRASEKDQLGIDLADLAEIQSLVKLGLRVEKLYRDLGPLFLNTSLEARGRIIDLINSQGTMWVSPDHRTAVTTVCDRMRLLFDN